MKPKSYLKVLFVLMLISGSLFGCSKNHSQIPYSTTNGNPVEVVNIPIKYNQIFRIVFISCGFLGLFIIGLALDRNRRISKNLSKGLTHQENKEALYKL